MTTIYHDADADLAALDGASVAVVGYGNQGRSWALNLRDSGFAVQVCVRNDASRDQAAADGHTRGWTFGDDTVERLQMVNLVTSLPTDAFAAIA